MLARKIKKALNPIITAMAHPASWPMVTSLIGDRLNLR